MNCSLGSMPIEPVVERGCDPIQARFHVKESLFSSRSGIWVSVEKSRRNTTEDAGTNVVGRLLVRFAIHDVEERI